MRNKIIRTDTKEDDFILNEGYGISTEEIHAVFECGIEDITADFSVDSNEIMMEIYKVLNEQCNVDFIHYRQNFFHYNIEKRMKINLINNLKDYLSLLKQDSEELRILCKSLLVGSTRFFRDSDAFFALNKSIIPDILKNKNPESGVRVWIVGCSTGEEAYSAAILFKEYMISVQRNFDVKIFATDVDMSAVEYAGKGLYPESIIEDVSLERLNRFFIKKNSQYQVTRQIRDMVEFSCHNVIDNPPFYKIDLISCRNLLIYYNFEVKKKVVSLFQFSLNKDGYLFLGAGETVDGFDNFFSVCDSKWNIYKCKDINKRRAIDNVSIQTIGAGLGNRKEDGGAAPYSMELDRYIKLVKEYMPPGIIFDKEGHFVQVCGKADKFIKHDDSECCCTSIEMLKEDLAFALDSAITRILKGHECVRFNSLRLLIDGKTSTVNLVVKPFDISNNNQLFIAVFEEVDELKSSTDTPESDMFDLGVQDGKDSSYIKALRHEKASGYINEEKYIEGCYTDNESNGVYGLTGTKKESFKSSEEKFRQFFDNSNDSIFVYRINAMGMPGRIEDVNKTACETFGFSKEELLSMSQYDIISEEYISEIPKINQRLFAQEYDAYEIYYTCKNGEKIPLEINSHIFYFNGEKYSLTTARDITRRKKYELGLRKSKERYKQLVQNSPFAILIIKNGRILFGNKVGFKLLGVKNSIEIIGQPIGKYFNNLDEKTLCEICKTDIKLSNEVIAPIEDRILRPDGNEDFVEITVMPFWFEGEKTVLMMVRDISSQKRAENLEKDIEKKNRLLNETLEYDNLKTEFFSNLSHEFRTPLNVIIGTLQLLDMYLRESIISDSSMKINKYTGMIKRNCYRLLRLVNNMIDITSIDMGLYQIHMNNHNIVSIVKEITESVAEFVEAKGISIIFDSSVEKIITACDRDKIQCIVLNILSNAIKCTGAGDTVRVSIHEYDNSVRISIEDTGIGIPEDKLGIIFERFRQVDKSLTRKHEGSGIGLSLVKSLVEMHDGKIWVNSEYGKGSEFLVEIPIRLTEKQDDSERRIESMSTDIEKIQIEFADIDI